jgi:hypothetical protein
VQAPPLELEELDDELLLELEEELLDELELDELELDELLLELEELEELELELELLLLLLSHAPNEVHSSPEPAPPLLVAGLLFCVQ